MEYTMGFAAKVLPARILESTATVTCVHKVSKQLAELGTVTNTITTTARVWQCHRHRWSSCCRDQEREREKNNNSNNNKHRQRGICWRFVLGFLISFSVRFYQVKSLSTLSTVKSSARVTVLHVQCCTVSIRHETAVQCCTSIMQFRSTFSVLLFFFIHTVIHAMHRTVLNYLHIHTLLTNACSAGLSDVLLSAIPIQQLQGTFLPVHISHFCVIPYCNHEN